MNDEKEWEEAMEEAVYNTLYVQSLFVTFL